MEAVKGPLKAELKRKNVTYAQLAGKLADIGVMDSEPNIRNKLAGQVYSGVPDPMPRGYRYVILAAVAGLSLTGAAQDHYGKGHRAKGDRQPQQSVAAASIVEPPARTPSPETVEAQCVNGNGDPEGCGRASAQATVDQARYARWQAIAGFLGVAVGLATLCAVVWAGKWAKAAAQHTETGAKEARRSADGAMITEKAYIFVQPTVESANPHPLSDVIIQNAGRTPALIRRMLIHIHTMPSVLDQMFADDGY